MPQLKNWGIFKTLNKLNTMKKIILLFFICSFAYGQNIWKDIDYTDLNNDSIYQLLDIKNEQPLVIAFNANNFLLHDSRYFILSKKEALIAQIYYTSSEYSKTFLDGKKFVLKDYLRKTNVKRADIKQMVKFILDKDYLQNVIQKNLERPLIQDEKGNYIYVPMCTSDGATYTVEFFQGNKYYKLDAYSPQDDCDRSREKLDLFLEFFKLIEDTWNITNTTQDRPVKE